MRRGLWALAAAAATLVACSTLKMDVGWDKNVDFSKYHTWAWRPDGSIKDPVWARRFQDVLSDQLASRALAQVNLDGSPDLWAVVHARFSSETEFVSYSPAWGYGWGYWAGPMETVAYQVPVGSVVIDLVDVGRKDLVWRGTASDVIRAGKSNEEREERLIQILSEMFAGYPPAPAAK